MVFNTVWAVVWDGAPHHRRKLEVSRVAAAAAIAAVQCLPLLTYLLTYLPTATISPWGIGACSLGHIRSTLLCST